MKYIDGRSSDPFWQGYRHQKKNAKRRGIEFYFTFEKWKEVWLESGKWELRGRNKGQYVMCRIGDLGAYEEANTFIATNAENTRTTVRVCTEETRQRMSAAQKGTPHLKARGVKRNPLPDHVKAKIRAKNLGKKNPNSSRSKWTKIITPIGCFDNGAMAATAFSVTTATAHNRCKSDSFPEWRYA